MKNYRDMSPEERATKVEQLFRQIAFIGDITPYKHTDEVYPRIKHLVEELHAITKIQEELHELDYKRVGVKNPTLS